MLRILLLLCVAVCTACVNDDLVASRLDADGDGHQSTEAGGDDCDDADPSVNPDEEEVCGNGLDDNCDGAVDDDGVGALRWYADGDGDGVGAGNAVSACEAPPDHTAADGDCDDADPEVSPAADERCGGGDEDCDGLVDDEDSAVVGQTTWYEDADGDGYGANSTAVSACEAPSGMVAEGDDCDDSRPEVAPGQDEICDGLDNDCDGAADDADDDVLTGIGGVVFWPDGDGDGFGDASVPPEAACILPSGHVEDGTDCDDTDVAIHPEATEVCSGIDEDCDGAVDDADSDLDPTTTSEWRPDEDGDGYGDAAASPVQACAGPKGQVSEGGDCDDADASIHPASTEGCDGIDNDCDGLVDDEDDSVDPADLVSYYGDDDGDGHGDPESIVSACEIPPGYSEDNTDCDDSEPSVHPAAPEVCDELDNDCDGLVDDEDASVDPSTYGIWYADLDGDMFGNNEEYITSCEMPAGYSAVPGDCDDEAAEVFPGGSEVCGGGDEDCDGLTDDADDSVDPATQSLYYDDVDGDGFGDDATAILLCDEGDRVEQGGDCDPALAEVHPDAVELCSTGYDDDCNGLANDEEPSPPEDASTWHEDFDRDGVGGEITLLACEAPRDHVPPEDAGDCDDSNDEVFPGAVEICNGGVDDDCDGLADDEDAEVDSESTTAWYVDADGDGFGALVEPVHACLAPAGHVDRSDDCDDGSADVNPDREEVCNDGVDDDCNTLADDADPFLDEDSTTAWYADVDGDGHGDPADVLWQCAAEGRVADGTDCDDSRADVSPGGVEVCDGGLADEDCDGLIDDADPDVDAGSMSTWYGDDDGDGYGDAEDSLLACEAPTAYVDQAGDCDDAVFEASPDAVELCASDFDDDCDGLVNDEEVEPPIDALPWYADADGDGYGDPAAEVYACEAPAGHIELDQDCDDGDPAVHPDASESCATAYDDDCNGLANDEESSPPADAIEAWADADGDGYGAALVGLYCSLPSGTSAIDGDCEDGSAAQHPGLVEQCDGVDTDCDGLIDDADPSVDPSSYTTWWLDGDGDGFGDPAAALDACMAPTGHVAVEGDCDDAEPAVHPEADEVCDGAVDEDCDGLIDDEDDSLVDGAPHWVDADGDGTGAIDPYIVDYFCVTPEGWSDMGNDCDDSDPDVHVYAIEVCNGVDDNCRNGIDDEDEELDLSTASSWYGDADGDGYGWADDSELRCEPSPGYVSNAVDCDDALASIHPDALELCDAGDVDEDCDGLADDLDPSVDPESMSDYHTDVDGDGYGAGDPIAACDILSGQSELDGDCDDSRPLVNPAGSEVCDLADADEDCDGLIDDSDPSVDLATLSEFYGDGDSDGFGDPAVDLEACDAPDGFVALATDCDDDDPGVYPGSVEVCDGSVDEDCDGLVDDADPSTDVSTMLEWYSDSDGDGWGWEGATPFLACDASATAAELSADCDEGDPAVNPGAEEVCANGVDDDCDSDTWCSPSGDYDLAVDYDLRLEGVDAEDRFGPVTGLGDIDGDGREDVAVAGEGIDAFGFPSNAGSIAVFTDVLSASTPGDASIYIRGDVEDGELGQSVSAGDLNGDGQADLATLAGMAADPGEVLVFHGPFPSLVTQSEADVRIVGTRSEFVESDHGNNRIDMVSTLEGIGGAELLVGSPDYDADGAAFLFDGPSPGTWSELDATTTIEGAGVFSGVGEHVATLHDVDGDGRVEIAVGIQQRSSWTDNGCVAIFMDPPSGTLDPLDADKQTCGADLEQRELVSALGDVTGTGLASVAIGANEQAAATEGRVRILSWDGAALNHVAVLEGISAGDRFGEDVAGVGDLDDDGLEDLVVAATGANRSYLFYGSDLLLGGTHSAADADASFIASTSLARPGAAADRVGDLDGDGVEDLALPSPRATNSSGAAEAGRVYFFLGRQL